MSDFSVDTQTLLSSSQTFERTADKIQSIAEDARRIINSTRSSITARLTQSNKSYVVYSSVSNCSRDMSYISSALNHISELYRNCEKAIESKDISSAFIDAKKISVALAEAAAAATSSDSVKPSWFDKYLEILGIPSWIGDFISGICDEFQGLAKIPALKKLIDSIPGSGTAIPIVSLFLSAPNLANSVLDLYKEIQSGGNFWNEIFSTGGAAIRFGGASSQVAAIGNQAAITKLSPILVYLNIAATGFDFTAESIETYNELAADGSVDMGDWGEIGIRSSVKGLNTLFCFGLLDDEAISDSIVNWAEDTGTAIGNAYLDAKEFFENLF